MKEKLQSVIYNLIDRIDNGFITLDDDESVVDLNLAKNYDKEHFVYVLTRKRNKSNAIIVAYLGDKKDIVIPTHFKDILVTKINWWAFSDLDINSIYIHKEITEIGEGAFSNCSNLRKVSIENQSKLKKIGNKSFYNTKIQELYIPDTVIEIGERAFQDCKELQTVTISKKSNLSRLGRSAFSSTSIEDIYIPKNIDNLSENQFIGCDKLKNVTFDSNSKLKVIGAFCYCSALEKIYIPPTVLKINDGAFEDCHNLKNVYFSVDSNLTTIGTRSFSNCFNLENIFIPRSVTTVGEMVFDGLKYIQISSSHEQKPKDWDDDWNTSNVLVDDSVEWSKRSFYKVRLECIWQ
jgi:hypothetical protein